MAKDHPTGKSGLYQAILKLETPEQCFRFFMDVCSYSELSAMEQRYNIAEMLADGRIYTDIRERTGASSAIISRVNRVLSARDSVLPSSWRRAGPARTMPHTLKHIKGGRTIHEQSSCLFRRGHRGMRGPSRR